MTLNIGHILNNRYRIVKKIKEGGFGAVYRAWDINLNLACALKENFGVTPEAERQFAREANILAALQHPNLPRVTDHFILAGQGQYLVMDFIEGDDLQTLLDQQGSAFAEPQAVEWTTQICDALTYLHSQNPPIIHRDIKPSNIKIAPNGKAMLVDFGIAKVYDPTALTTTGARAVTPGYSPQEQYVRGSKTDARSDIYALGATLYALLTAQEPFESIERSMGKTMPMPRTLNPKIAPHVESAILRAMELKPDQRFQTADELKTTLHNSQSYTMPQTVVVTPPTQAMPQVAYTMSVALARQTQKISPLAITGIVGAVMVVVLFTVSVTTGASFLTLFNSTNTPGATLVIAAATTAPTDTVAITTAPAVKIVTPTHTRTPSPLPPTSLPSNQTSSNDGSIMVHVPSGDFIMSASSSESQFPDEQPRHTVYLDTFWIDLTEVTNEKFATFVKATGYVTDLEKKGGVYTYNSGWVFVPNASWRTPFGASSSRGTKRDQPVTQVSWNDAVAYCSWAGKRMPTEAEWEKAARGTDGRIYPWGNSSPNPSLASYGNNFDEPSSVGSYPNGASPFGLLDMGGNVYEWVNDWYSVNYFSNSPSRNPTGPSESSLAGKAKVMRGGSWQLDAYRTRVFEREVSTPDYGNSNVGFRCVK
jgi:formylglycine-generating enzyme required for sulfatase activity